MGFLKRLFASPDVVKTTVDGVYHGIDKAFYTDEEKAEDAAAARAVYKAMWLAAVPSAVNRRLIAAGVTAMWILIILVMLSAKAAGMDEFAAYAQTIMADIVAIPFGIIVSFYFLKAVIPKK